MANENNEQLIKENAIIHAAHPTETQHCTTPWFATVTTKSDRIAWISKGSPVDIQLHCNADGAGDVT